MNAFVFLRFIPHKTICARVQEVTLNAKYSLAYLDVLALASCDPDRLFLVVGEGAQQGRLLGRAHRRGVLEAAEPHVGLEDLRRPALVRYFRGPLVRGASV
jgi:hypothetical protein